MIDAHIHLNEYEHNQVALQQKITQLNKQLHRHQIQHGLIISSYTTNQQRPGNKTLLQELNQQPHLQLVEGIQHHGRTPPRLTETQQRLENQEIVGLKLYPGYLPTPVTGNSYHGVYQLAEQYDVPVIIHTGDTFCRHAHLRHTHPFEVDAVAADFPDVKFVMAHFGNPDMITAANVMYKNDNVYADLSGLVVNNVTPQVGAMYNRWFSDAITFMGKAATRRVMFGTDWSIVNYDSYMTFWQQYIQPLLPEPEYNNHQTAQQLYQFKDTNKLQ